MKVSLRSLSAPAALVLMVASCAAQNSVQQSAQGSVQDRVQFPQDLAQSQAASPADASKPQPPQSSDSGHGVSQVRIVRISQVNGQVRLDRNTDQKFETAFLNLPIVAGEQLQTLDGLAEVEFENNSSLRLTPNSLVAFPVLQRDATGATSTTVKLLRGSIYVSLADSKGADGFTIVAGNQTIALTPSSHLRLDLTGPSAKLVVLKGNVTVADASGSTLVGKNKAVTFDTTASAALVSAHNEGSAMFDKWDKNAVAYHQQRSAAMGFTNSPYAYGVNDMSYYGSYSNLGGCGSLWRPYLAGASFNPYGSGVWSWYPGSGYSFVSPYPWGWTPYHSGSWEFCPSSGSWGWRPSGGWNGLNTVQAARSIRNPGRPLPPSPPGKGEPTLVGYNVKTLTRSHLDSDSRFVLAHDSAGLGVPRGVFNNLGKLSQTAAQHGSATMTLSDSQAQRGMIATNRNLSASSVRGPVPSAGPSSMSTRASSVGAASHGSLASSSGAGASHASGGASSAASGGGGSHH